MLQRLLVAWYSLLKQGMLYTAAQCCKAHAFNPLSRPIGHTRASVGSITALRQLSHSKLLGSITALEYICQRHSRLATARLATCNLAGCRTVCNNCNQLPLGKAEQMPPKSCTTHPTQGNGLHGWRKPCCGRSTAGPLEDACLAQHTTLTHHCFQRQGGNGQGEPAGNGKTTLTLIAAAAAEAVEGARSRRRGWL